jgi:MFS family permease
MNCEFPPRSICVITSPALLRQRNFLLLWGGQGISIFGSMLSAIARPFLILRIGGGVGGMSVVLALTSLPFVFLALPAGAWIDRWDRKRTMIISDIARGLAIGSLMIALLIGHVSLAIIYASALGEGIGTVFFSLAETASLPQVVSKEQLSLATNYNQALFSIAFLAGPPLGGALFALNSFLPFSLDALSFLISIISLRLITVPFQQPRPVSQPHLLREISEGILWLWHEPQSRYLTVVYSLVNIALGGSVLIFIQLVARALPHVSARALPAFTGTLLTFAGIGGILGSIVCAGLLQCFTLPRLICGSLWLQGSILTLLVVAPGYVGLAVLFVASYFLWPSFNAALSGYRLARIPDQLQGRVNSVYRLCGYGADPVGALLIGILLSHTGIVVTTLARGLFILGIALLTSITFRRQVMTSA